MSRLTPRSAVLRPKRTRDVAGLCKSPAIFTTPDPCCFQEGVKERQDGGNDEDEDEEKDEDEDEGRLSSGF